MIDSVPLIQNPNDAQQINASIIAMKKASRELNEKIVKLNSLNSELDKKIALLDSGLNKEIEDRKEAINSLDVSSVGGSGKYISAISETDGKIRATVSDLTSVIESGNSQPVTSGGVFNEINKCQKKFSAFVTGNGSYIDITPTENIENYIVNFGYSSTRYANVGIIYFLNVNGVITVNYKDLVKTQSFVTSPSVELLADGKFRFTHNFGDGSASLIVKV